MFTVPFRIALFSLSVSVGVSVSNAATDNIVVDAAEVQRVLNVSDDIAYGEYLAGECASCHLKSVTAGSSVPVIQGSTAEYLVAALLEYRMGIRKNTTMGSVASALGDEEIAVLARYISTQKE